MNMKHAFLITLSTILLCQKTIGQGATNINPAKSYVNVNIPKTPESAGFEKYGNPEVSEFSGTTNISIPIYTLQSRFLSAPITLAYQTTGIKVNQEASWVGLGFDLIAGGRITVETRGAVDFCTATRGLTSVNTATAMGQIFSRLNNSRENAVLTPATTCPPNYCSDPNMYNFLGVSEMTQFGTGEPDIFRANFLGHSLTFYVDKITNNINFIGEQSNFHIQYNLDAGNNIINWSIVDNDGVKYYFNQTETTTNTLAGSPVVPASSTSAWLLTKVLHPTGDSIIFNYSNYGYSVPAFSMSGSITADAAGGGVTVANDRDQNVSLQSPYYLSRMESADIAIDFVMDGRTDLYGPGSRKLNQIKVTDKANGQVKKTTTFNYSYFQGDINAGSRTYLNSLSYYLPPSLSATDYIACSNKRLKLDSVSVTDNTYQPPYRFHYNSTVVPDKYSLSQDHWGYYNSVPNQTNGYGFSHLIPLSGLKGVSDLFPSSVTFNITNFGFSRDCDPSQMQVMTLDSLIYPTGGSSAFTYEPHQSTMLPTIPVIGGGMRVKTIKNYASGILTGTKEYTYTGGKYMGNISYFTTSNTLSQCSSQSPFSFGAWKYSSNGALNSNDILIGYANTTIIEKDAAGQTNGSLVKTFNINTASSNYANGLGFDTEPPYFPPAETTPPYGSQNYIFWLDPSNKALPPTPSSSLEGKLVQEMYLDNTNTPLKKVNYYYHLANYTNNFYDVKALQNRVGGFDFGNCPGGVQEGYGTGGLRAVNLFVSPAKSFHALTDSVVETSYAGTNTLTSRKYYTYDSRYLVKTEQDFASDGTSTTTAYTHPYDYITGYNGQSGTSTMILQMMSSNIINPVFTTAVTRNGNNLQSINNIYFNPSPGVYVPQSTVVQIGNSPAETRQVYNNYDSYGHLLERQAPGGIKEDFLWGYNTKYPVAHIIGSDYTTVSAIVNTGVLNNPSDDNTLRTELNKLRTQLPGASVTTYTYDPVFGMTSETDPRGKTKYYTYDAVGRLSLILDQDRNVLRKITYNYAGQPENNTTPAYINDQQQATFTGTSCAAGLIAQSNTYTVPVGKYMSYIDKAAANQQALVELNANGQAAANALPCLAPFNGTNKTSIPWNITITNTASTFNNTYSFYPAASALLFANIPVGNYTITLSPMYPGSVTSPVQLLLNGTTYTGTSFNFTNTSINSATTITLQNPPASGPCSFTVSSGYSSPTSSISNNGTTASGYFVFYPTSTMTQGNNYMVATVNGGCRPTGVRTFSTTGGGRNWTVTVYPSGEMYVQMAYGSAPINPYSTVSITISYNL